MFWKIQPGYGPNKSLYILFYFVFLFSSFEYFHEYLISSAYMLTDYCINGSTSIPGTDVGLSRAYIILLSNIFYVLTAGTYSERQHKSNET